MAEEEPIRKLLGEFLALLRDAGSDFSAAIADQRFLEMIEGLMADDAETLFVVPSGGFVGDMAGPWIGPEGFVAGWTEWLGGFEDFRIETEETIVCGEDAVLFLVTTFARLRGSPAVIEQKAAAIYRASGGRLTRIEFYLDQDQARRVAGLEPTR